MRFFNLVQWRWLLFLVFLLPLSARSEVKTLDRQGQKIDISRFQFKDEEGRIVKLASFFQPKKPVFLAPVYYGCPGVCTVTLNQLFEDVRRLRFNPGRALEVVVISIDPKETAELAKNKKQSYLKRFKYEESADGFHFLVGEQDQITALTRELGFFYERNGDQFNHPGAIYLLTPEGRISKLLTGLKTPLKALHNYVYEAANGRKISSFERMALSCKASAETQ